MRRVALTRRIVCGYTLLPMDALITSRDAAHRLGVSITHFHRLTTRKGITPAVDVPGGKLWTRADIDALEAERATA